MTTVPQPTPDLLGAIFGDHRYRTREQVRESLIDLFACTPSEAEAAIDRWWRENWLFAAVFTVFCKRTGRMRLTSWFRPGSAQVDRQPDHGITASIG